MKKMIDIVWVLMVLLSTTLYAESEVLGSWQGFLDVNGNQLKLVVHIKNEGGKLSATMDSPDQGAFGIPVDLVETKKGVLAFKIPAIGASYHGTWDEGVQAISGTFNQGMALPLNLLPLDNTLPTTESDVDDQATLMGQWFGAIQLPQSELDFVLDIEEHEGVVVAKATSPQQSKQPFPVDVLTFKSGQLEFEIKALGVAYSGQIDKTKNLIKGHFSQGGQSLVLHFTKGQYQTKTNRPQNPKQPYNYAAEDVVFINKSTGDQLAGTLTVPKGKIKSTLILITGSGPQDRDETLFEHKPFWVIADHLSEHGFAVLRMDDRGVGDSEGDFKAATTQDFVTDISAAVDFVNQRDDLPRHQVGLLGHSEGGMIAPMLAAQRQDLSYLVLLAGPGIPIVTLLADQVRDGGLAAGAPVEEMKALWGKTHKRNQYLAQWSGNKNYAKKVASYLADHADSDESTKQRIQAEAKAMSTPWFEYFIQFDPAEYLAQVNIPVLALNGEHDVQVAHQANLDGIEAGLKAAKNDSYTIKSYPKLNHLFQTSGSGAVHEYGKIEETIAPVVLDDIVEWLNQLHQ